jgi:hypothetical protein
MTVASPGLRSKRVLPMNSPGKKAQESAACAAREAVAVTSMDWLTLLTASVMDRLSLFPNAALSRYADFEQKSVQVIGIEFTDLPDHCSVIFEFREQPVFRIPGRRKN